MTIKFKQLVEGFNEAEDLGYITEEELNEMPAPTHVVPAGVTHKIGDTVKASQSYGRGQTRTMSGVVTAMGRKHTYVQPTEKSAKESGILRAHYKILHKDVVKESAESVQEETVEVQKQAKTYSTFSAWLSEAACAPKMKKEEKKAKVEVHDGDDDGKALGEDASEIEEGQIVKTATGIRHKGTYGSEYDTDEEGNEKKKEAPAAKRGRGRPKKGSDETGNVKKYTIHPALAKFGSR